MSPIEPHILLPRSYHTAKRGVLTMKQAFEAGMHIRYGGTGICLIERVAEVPYPGEQPMRMCYILRPVRNSSMEVSVPLDNETLCAKMQPLRSREEIDRMLNEAAHDDEMPWIEDRKQRSAEFRRILSGGDAQTLLRMIHCILRQQTLLKGNGKRLTAMDDNARKDAARMLDEEFGFSLGLTPDQASVYICEKLNIV
jgi:RNA polymerase-interacting CarD/CdnL/TRCF family regulator